MNYYTDLNSTNRELITLYEEQSDIYRDDWQYKKFIDCINKLLSDRPSEFVTVLSQLVNGPAKLFEKYNAEVGSLPGDWEFAEVTREAATSLESTVNFITRDLVAEILANGRPDKKAVAAHQATLDRYIDNALCSVTAPEFSHLSVERRDCRFVQKVFKMNEARVSSKSVTADEIKQYIADTGIKKYFRTTPGFSKPSPRETHLNIKLSAFHDEKHLAHLWAYNNLFDGLREIYHEIGEILRTRTQNFCQLSADELAYFPKIVPGKCKLLIEHNMHSISSNSNLDSDDLSALLNTKFKVLKIGTGTESNLISDETVLINDSSIMKIIDRQEEKTDQQR